MSEVMGSEVERRGGDGGGVGRENEQISTIDAVDV